MHRRLRNHILVSSLTLMGVFQIDVSRAGEWYSPCPLTQTQQTMLFVTTGSERIQNIRTEMQDLSSELADYYRLTTFDKAMGDFLAGNWQSRALTDTAVYPLVREEGTDSG